MDCVLWTSENEKWTIAYRQTRQTFQTVVYSGTFIDYPYLTLGGIVYDYPERIPTYVRYQIHYHWIPKLSRDSSDHELLNAYYTWMGR